MGRIVGRVEGGRGVREIVHGVMGGWRSRLRGGIIGLEDCTLVIRRRTVLIGGVRGSRCVIVLSRCGRGPIVIPARLVRIGMWAAVRVVVTAWRRSRIGAPIIAGGRGWRIEMGRLRGDRRRSSLGQRREKPKYEGETENQQWLHTVNGARKG